MTIKLEVGKFYKQRNGGKLFCVGIDRDERYVMQTCDALNTIIIYTPENVQDWKGRSWEIISEWSPEPKQIKGYANVYKDDRSTSGYKIYGLHSTKETALSGASRDIILATIEIDIPEGHGIEKEE